MARATQVTHPRPWLRGILPAIAMALAVCATPFAPAAQAAGKRIVVTGTIQAAVNAARPGDTVFVPPGTYVGTVLVNTSDLTIEGAPGAIVDAARATNAISVGTGRITQGSNGVPVCPPLAVRNFVIRGLTVRNATRNGIVLRGVDGFRISGGTYTNNDAYGIFPICSRNGVIEGNTVDGSDDTGIYVGDSDNVTIVGNRVFDNTSGILIENATRITARGNHAVGNTAGIAVILLPGLPVPRTDDVLVEGNLAADNNRPNPIPLGPSAESRIPSGSGILNLAGDRVVVRHNLVTGNNTVGLAIVANLLAGVDPRVEPNPDHNRVVGNNIVNNGAHPDLERNGGLPGADIVYDGSGVGNCFGQNRFGSDFPPGITAHYPCP